MLLKVYYNKQLFAFEHTNTSSLLTQALNGKQKTSHPLGPRFGILLPPHSVQVDLSRFGKGAAKTVRQFYQARAFGGGEETPPEVTHEMGGCVSFLKGPRKCRKDLPFGLPFLRSPKEAANKRHPSTGQMSRWFYYLAAYISPYIVGRTKTLVHGAKGC